MNCRCGAVATKTCSLCKDELCEFHSTELAVQTQMPGYVRTRLEPVCFPNCTSSFGERELSDDEPRAQA